VVLYDSELGRYERRLEARGAKFEVNKTSFTQGLSQVSNNYGSR